MEMSEKPSSESESQGASFSGEALMGTKLILLISSFNNCVLEHVCQTFQLFSLITP